MGFIIKRKKGSNISFGGKGERYEVFWDVVDLFGGNTVSIMLLICLFV
jgi:hypothetical protein